MSNVWETLETPLCVPSLGERHTETAEWGRLPWRLLTANWGHLTDLTDSCVCVFFQSTRRDSIRAVVFVPLTFFLSPPPLSSFPWWNFPFSSPSSTVYPFTVSRFSSLALLCFVLMKTSATSWTGPRCCLPGRLLPEHNSIIAPPGKS